MTAKDNHIQALQTLLEEGYYEHYRFEADPGQQPLRIDKYLLQRLPGTSRNRIQNAARAGCIIVDEKPVKPNFKVKPGHIISLVLPEPPHNFELIAEDIPFDIVYEDDAILIINKSAGMVVHPGHGNYTGTLVNAVLHHFSALPGKPDNEPRPGLVHRLDKDTSGLLIVAKTEWAMTYLAKQFFDHSVKRTYQTLVWGVPEEDSGTIDTYIGRSSKDRRVMTVIKDESRGKKAVTHYKTLEKLEHVSLLECRLETGRTHQIRVHMQHMGNPVFNDTTYGGDKIVKGTTFTKYKQFVQNCFKTLPRQALHAKTLGFIHPDTKEEMYFESPLPEDFRGALEKWRGYVKQ